MTNHTVKLELTQGEIEDFYRRVDSLEQAEHTVKPEDVVKALGAFHKSLATLEPKPTSEEYTALLTQYAHTVRTARGGGVLPAPVQRGVILRAARDAGILTGVGSVGALPPWQATQIEKEITEAIVAAFTVPNA